MSTALSQCQGNNNKQKNKIHRNYKHVGMEVVNKQVPKQVWIYSIGVGTMGAVGVIAPI